MDAVITQLQSIVGWSGEFRNPEVMFNQSLQIGLMGVKWNLAENPNHVLSWSVTNWTNIWVPELELVFIVLKMELEFQSNFDIGGDWRSGPS